MALAPQLSRAAYRRGYLQSLSRQAANEAYNLEANLRWLQDGDVEGEAQKAATIQGMARGAIDSKVIELVNYIVRQPDRGFVLSRIPLDQKRWLLINEDTFLATLTENSRAVPVSGMEFLSVLAAVVRPVQPNNVANQVQQQIAEEHGALTEEPQTAPTNVAPQPSVAASPAGLQGAVQPRKQPKPTQKSPATELQSPVSAEMTPTPTLQQALNNSLAPHLDSNLMLRGGNESDTDDDTDIHSIMSASTVPLQDHYELNDDPTGINVQRFPVGTEHYTNSRNETINLSDYKNTWYNKIAETKDKAGHLRNQEAFNTHLLNDNIPSRTHTEMIHANNVNFQRLQNVQAETLRRQEEGPYNLRHLFGQRGKGLPGRKKTYIRGAGMNPAPGAREPSHNWQQFGRYVLSRNDLENGSSVHIRYRNGQPVKNVGPKRVVGGSVGAIVRDIADGKAPQQRHMSQITEDEREYLSGLIKTCNIAIPNGVKTEKKTPKQKEHNEFEILKGQVLAGNDNPEIIKKFKNMLKKMVHSGQLNADDVRAIVDELP